MAPLRNGTPAGDAAATGLAELFDDVVHRLRREGRPVPPELLGDAPADADASTGTPTKTTKPRRAS